MPLLLHLLILAAPVVLIGVGVSLFVIRLRRLMRLEAMRADRPADA